MEKNPEFLCIYPFLNRRKTVEDMGGCVFVEEHTAINIWIDFLQECDIDYEKETLLDLIWTKNWGLEPTKETPLDMNTWMQTLKYRCCFKWQ